MKIHFFPLIAILFLYSSCQNRHRATNPSAKPSGADSNNLSGFTDNNAFQVHKDDYDQQFVSNYGLLHLKTSNDPFTGRILTIDGGQNGEYVYADENWVNGRKHGLSTKWFSNGVKMYERNYKDGKWHGTVTRWWPNGQKMYVRAYSKGIRHGKEATWRSDGTPVSISSDTASEVGKPVKTKPVSEKVESPETTDLPTTDLPSIELPAFEEDEAPKPSSPPIDLNSQISENGAQSPSFDNSNAPAVEPEIETDPSGFDGFPPPLPPLDDPIADEDIAEPSSEDDPSLLLPVMNDAEASNPGFSEDNALGDLPPADSLEGSPPLPPLDDSNELPELPGLDNTDADSDPLPPLSDMESADDLPPLPAGDSDFDSLPPLPPLP